METSIGERSALIKPLDGYGVFRSVSCRCKRVYRDFYRESKLKRHRARLYAVNWIPRSRDFSKTEARNRQVLAFAPQMNSMASDKYVDRRDFALHFIYLFIWTSEKEPRGYKKKKKKDYYGIKCRDLMKPFSRVNQKIITISLRRVNLI